MSCLPRLQGQKQSNPEYAAEQAIRDYCGWHVAPAIEDTLIVDGNGGRKILLPTRHINSVRSVLVDGVPVDYRWSENGWISLKSGFFPHVERVVEVKLNHGFESNDVIDQVISAMTARARMSPAGNVVSQRAGTQSVTFASSGGQVASFPLMDAEKELLMPYKLTWGP